MIELTMTEPGIYGGVPMGVYVNDPCSSPSANKGALHTILTRSPAHAWREHPRFGGPSYDYSARADLGSATHALLFGGAQVVPIDAADWRTKAAREARDAAYAAGQIPILRRQAEQLDAAADAAAEHITEALGIEEIGHPDLTEQTMIWRDDGDHWCRARFDFLDRDRGLALDLKTASTAEPRAWLRTSFAAGGYDLQAAHYLRGLERLGHTGMRWAFVVQEIEEPYATSIIELTPDYLDHARRKWQIAYDAWRRCMDTRDWPAYPPEIYYAEPPTWEVERFKGE